MKSDLRKFIEELLGTDKFQVYNDKRVSGRRLKLRFGWNHAKPFTESQKKKLLAMPGVVAVGFQERRDIVRGNRTCAPGPTIHTDCDIRDIKIEKYHKPKTQVNEITLGKFDVSGNGNVREVTVSQLEQIFGCKVRVIS